MFINTNDFDVYFIKNGLRSNRTPIDSNTLIQWKMNDIASPIINYGTAGTLNLATYAGSQLYGQSGIFDKSVFMSNTTIFSTGNTSVGETSGTTFTLSFWVNITSYTVYGVMFCKNISESWASPFAAIYISLDNTNDGAVYLSMDISGVQKIIQISATDGIPLEIWTLISVTYDGSNIRYYRNGIIKGTPYSAPGSIDYLLHSSWNVGGLVYQQSGQHLVGKMEDIRVENTVRSASYLLAMYNKAMGI